MKRILLLGGSAQQVVAIKTAHKLGFETILCDYLPDNPGKEVADHFFQVSTTDREDVLAVAQNMAIDGVLAYASDPAAPTAAFVAEKMGLNGNPLTSVEILCNKDRFRRFLCEHNFHTPYADSFDNLEEALEGLASGLYSDRVIVKPVDSSGSKGVAKIVLTEGWNSPSKLIDIKEKLMTAVSFSKRGRIIIEDYVDQSTYQVAGDGLSMDGELVFSCFANDHFNPHCKNPYVPIAASFPSILPERVQVKIRSEVQRLLSLLNMGTTTYNFDIRINDREEVYLMEVAPRSGGNYIPQVIQYATGFDMLEAVILATMGEPVSVPEQAVTKGFWSYFAIHSTKDGLLKKIVIDPTVESQHIIENHIIKFPGDEVTAFTGANTTLGILVMRFDSSEQMLRMMDDHSSWLEVCLE